MAEANTTCVLSVSEETSQKPLKIEQIDPRWSFDRPGVRLGIVRAMNAVMQVAA